MSDRLLKESDVLREVESLLISDETRHLNDLEYGNNQALCHLIDRIEDLPSADRPSAVDLSNVYSTAYKSGYEKGKADRPQEWIPCSERLPAKAGHYLCSFKKPNRIDNIFVDLAYWTGGRWYGYLANEINAWMPLPEPWKGADDD